MHFFVVAAAPHGLLLDDQLSIIVYVSRLIRLCRPIKLKCWKRAMHHD